MIKIQSSLREKTGSSSSRRLLKSGLIPAAIQTKSEKPLYIKIDAKEIEREYAKGNLLSTLAKITIDKKETEAIIRRIDTDPVTENIIHIEFIDCKNTKEVKIKSKIKFINIEKSAGIKRGGFFHVTKRHIALICNKENIPNFIEINVEKLTVGSKIRLSDIILPEGSKLAPEKDDLIASIMGRGLKAEEEDSKTEEVAEDKESKDEKPKDGEKK
ncbi:50S ribosomal protein L25/general stress protein Ctc [Flavobacteriaceae bacterium]|nr:50S ribosomal protein L25/general stress protein Ctc [Flavobacteriaceae bacterium]